MALGGNWFYILQGPADCEKTRPANDDILQWNNSNKRWELVNKGVLSSADFIYFGATDTNGTWRIGRSGNNLVFQLRESGTYVTKGKMTP